MKQHSLAQEFFMWGTHEESGPEETTFRDCRLVHDLGDHETLDHTGYPTRFAWVKIDTGSGLIKLSNGDQYQIHYRIGDKLSPRP